MRSFLKQIWLLPTSLAVVILLQVVKTYESTDRALMVSISAFYLAVMLAASLQDRVRTVTRQRDNLARSLGSATDQIIREREQRQTAELAAERMAAERQQWIRSQIN